MSDVRTRSVTVFTHQIAERTAGAVETLRDIAQESGIRLRMDPNETTKHTGLDSGCFDCDAPVIDDVDLCIVLGGDGTILRALRRYAGTSVPVFAINFGEVGFLATMDPDEAGEAFRRALAGDFETLTLPALALELEDEQHAAINDLSLHRQLGGRVATLAYAINHEEVGSVRCDGLVLATPAGSTGYNLANGGPVMAWGVEGYVVSFIAPHSLVARALVVAPDDELIVSNRGRDPVDLSVDGRPVSELGPGEAVTARFVRAAAELAQLPGSSFYRRLRDRFGRLAGGSE